MDRTTLQRILLGLLTLVLCFIGLKTFDIEIPELQFNNSQKSSGLTSTSSSFKMTYGRFLDYLEMGWVTQVDLYNNNRKAIAEASSPELGNRPQSIEVDLPIGASQVIQKLKESNVNFDSHPASQKSIYITIASNLLLPLL